MNKNIKGNWCNGLRSHRWQKNIGGLHGGKNLRCPLGVLCDLYIYSSAGRNANASWCKQLFISECEDHERLHLPIEVQRWADLHSHNPIVGSYGTVVDLNDVKKLSLSEIADLIEIHL